MIVYTLTTIFLLHFLAYAMGYGGNYIIVSKEHKLVVVFTSELYNDTFLPLRLFKDHILNQLI